MKVLHILRTEPEETVEKFTHHLAEEHEMSVVALDEDAQDGGGLVDDIFAYDKVICWW